jgi:ribosome biogenesis protein MAK21
MALQFPKGVPWFELLFAKSDAPTPLTPHESRARFSKAKTLYSAYLESSSTDPLTVSILESGTLKDKFTAMKVAAQESPLTTLPHLTTLNGLLNGKPRIAIFAMQTAEQIFTKFLLPDRALRSFADHPVGDAKDSHLLLFYFEDQLKNAYAAFIRSLEQLAKAQQAFVRDPAIRCIGSLLRSKPEAERVLLTILVDKFGDPLKQVAGVATATILEVLREHPRMTQAVITAVKTQEVRFDAEAQNRALKFLGQLSVEADRDSGRELFQTVCPQLLAALKSSGETNTRVLQSLMRSAEKCAAVCTPEEMAPLIGPLYTFVHGATLAASLPALGLLFSVHKAAGDVPQRFFGLLFGCLVHADLGAASKQPQLLRLVAEAVGSASEGVAAAFVHRLLQISLHATPAFCAAALIVTGRIFAEKPNLRGMFASANAKDDALYNFEELGEGAIAAFPWTLSLFVKHFDPAVRSIAADVAAGREIVYEGDPFEDFTAAKQLRRIVDGATDGEAAMITRAMEEFDAIPAVEDDNGTADGTSKKKKRRKG